ncbi:hypothetical protein FB45DRAFT_874882 [Roridomyces roridus]|uniref:Uncharacterized protein n=1 Tax=Roridomyces roridus TaxID=1738132 RepID=A0AAD7FDK4_9AGAR|nr:hypothetical protein FB45DRAFT_874882 [Roridomyces roridus]
MCNELSGTQTGLKGFGTLMPTDPEAGINALITVPKQLMVLKYSTSGFADGLTEVSVNDLANLTKNHQKLSNPIVVALILSLTSGLLFESHQLQLNNLEIYLPSQKPIKQLVKQEACEATTKYKWTTVCNILGGRRWYYTKGHWTVADGGYWQPRSKLEESKQTEVFSASPVPPQAPWTTGKNQVAFGTTSSPARARQPISVATRVQASCLTIGSLEGKKEAQVDVTVWSAATQDGDTGRWPDTGSWLPRSKLEESKQAEGFSASPVPLQAPWTSDSMAPQAQSSEKAPS